MPVLQTTAVLTRGSFEALIRKQISLALSASSTGSQGIKIIVPKEGVSTATEAYVYSIEFEGSGDARTLVAKRNGVSILFGTGDQRTREEQEEYVRTTLIADIFNQRKDPLLPMTIKVEAEESKSNAIKDALEAARKAGIAAIKNRKDRQAKKNQGLIMAARTGDMASVDYYRSQGADMSAISQGVPFDTDIKPPVVNPRPAKSVDTVVEPQLQEEVAIGIDQQEVALLQTTAILTQTGLENLISQRILPILFSSLAEGESAKIDIIAPQGDVSTIDAIDVYSIGIAKAADKKGWVLELKKKGEESFTAIKVSGEPLDGRVLAELTETIFGQSRSSTLTSMPVTIKVEGAKVAEREKIQKELIEARALKEWHSQEQKNQRLIMAARVLGVGSRKPFDFSAIEKKEEAVRNAADKYVDQKKKDLSGEIGQLLEQCQNLSVEKASEEIRAIAAKIRQFESEGGDVELYRSYHGLKGVYKDGEVFSEQVAELARVRTFVDEKIKFRIRVLDASDESSLPSEVDAKKYGLSAIRTVRLEELEHDKKVQEARDAPAIIASASLKREELIKLIIEQIFPELKKSIAELPEVPKVIKVQVGEVVYSIELESADEKSYSLTLKVDGEQSGWIQKIAKKGYEAELYGFVDVDRAEFYKRKNIKPEEGFSFAIDESWTAEEKRTAGSIIDRWRLEEQKDMDSAAMQLAEAIFPDKAKKAMPLEITVSGVGENEPSYVSIKEKLSEIGKKNPIPVEATLKSSDSAGSEKRKLGIVGWFVAAAKFIVVLLDETFSGKGSKKVASGVDGKKARAADSTSTMSEEDFASALGKAQAAVASASPTPLARISSPGPPPKKRKRYEGMFLSKARQVLKRRKIEREEVKKGPSDDVSTGPPDSTPKGM